jgi:hypothetical protein
MTLHTRNLTFSNLVRVEEQCTYRQDPHNPHITTFAQTGVIESVKGWSWLTGQVEDFCVGRFRANAQRGRMALEEAIEKIEGVVDRWAEGASLFCDASSSAIDCSGSSSSSSTSSSVNSDNK